MEPRLGKLSNHRHGEQTGDGKSQEGSRVIAPEMGLFVSQRC
ncbi:MAG: hypothetical protein ACT4TC_23670 [Myxococcaceae bacterium]